MAVTRQSEFTCLAIVISRLRSIIISQISRITQKGNQRTGTTKQKKKQKQKQQTCFFLPPWSREICMGVLWSGGGGVSYLNRHSIYKNVHKPTSKTGRFFKSRCHDHSAMHYLLHPSRLFKNLFFAVSGPNSPLDSTHTLTTWRRDAENCERVDELSPI